MQKYCLDTSGFSNPILSLPSDIYVSLWKNVCLAIKAGSLCWNEEIAEELQSIQGDLGLCLQQCNEDCCFKIGDSDWNWREYLVQVERFRTTYKNYISEYNGNRKATIGLNDVSIVAFAKTLRLPVLSMENPGRQPSDAKMRIPDLCAAEHVPHLTFNEFLRAEGIRI